MMSMTFVGICIFSLILFLLINNKIIDPVIKIALNCNNASAEIVFTISNIT